MQQLYIMAGLAMICGVWALMQVWMLRESGGESVHSGESSGFHPESCDACEARCDQ